MTEEPTTRRLAVLALAVLALAGCPGTEPPDEPDFDDISGAWEGTMTGTGKVLTLDLEAAVSLGITQDDSTFTAGWHATEAIEVDGRPWLFDVEASFTGTLAEGRDPSLSVSMDYTVSTSSSPEWCGGTTTLAGTHFSDDRRIVLSGTLTTWLHDFSRGCVSETAFEVSVTMVPTRAGP